MSRPVNRPVGVCLIVMCVSIFVMVLIGGITRLTDSGLSMVEWKLLTGTVPPLSEVEWQKTFEKYQEFPQYRLLNPGMTLEGFKSIFLWEYFHRVWGRALGVIVFLPFVYFWIRRRIDGRMAARLVLAFVLGGLQGLLGWFMVKSGLVDVPWVSPLRLTAHLLLGFFLLGYVTWLTFDHYFGGMEERSSSLPGWIRPAAWGVMALAVVQFFWGGLMSGLKAARAFPTFPTMNGEWIPTFFWDSGKIVLENVALVQFSHRIAAVLLVLAIMGFCWGSRGISRSALLLRARYAVLACVCGQFMLGVLTVLHSAVKVPVGLGVSHQAGAGLLLIALVWLVFAVEREYRSGRPA